MCLFRHRLIYPYNNLLIERPVVTDFVTILRPQTRMDGKIRASLHSSVSHIHTHTQSCRKYYLLSNRYRGGIVSTDRCEDKFDWSESKGERFGSITLVNEHPRHASPPNRKENLTFVAFESTGSSSFSSGRKWMERVDISNWRIGIRRSSLHIYICIGIYQIIPLGQPVSTQRLAGAVKKHSRREYWI